MGRSLALQPQQGIAGIGRAALLVIAMMILMQASGCSSFNFGPDISTRTTFSQPVGTQQALPAAAGEPIGNGPVRVALLLPLSGDLANVGISMANGARLAMDFVQANPSVGDNITLVLKDTQGNPDVAVRVAGEAINEGASLILGPLRAESVQAAGAVARQAGVPVIGFSNNTGAASPGVYLLNVLPETEVRRSLAYAQAQGRRAFAAIASTSDFGRIQEGAFRQAIADLGLSARAVYNFTPGDSGETEARRAIEQVIPLIQAGQIDALFLPDRATAPSFAVLLEAAGIDRTRLTIIGSADWDNDLTIPQTNFLVGSIYPAIGDAGQQALTPEYQAKFGAVPHPFATIAYTATLLANSSSLALSTPRYSASELTRAGGFNGRDGQFRFLSDGRSEYALVIKQVVAGGAQQIDGPNLLSAAVALPARQ